MDESVAEKLKTFMDQWIYRHTGNILLVIGSSECGKSTMLANVILPIFCYSNGFITTFMSHSYDSIPIKQMILKSLADAEKKKVVAKNSENPEDIQFKPADMYKSKEWLFTRRGYDPDYIRRVYGLKLQLEKHYGSLEKTKDFRFVMALDDEIDIGGKFIRQVCQTWRNKGISWIQLVQDITNFDMAVRNSAALVMFGYINFPARREQIVRGYLEPYLPGLTVKEKMDSYKRFTENKCFIFMNHRERCAWRLDTHTGNIQELREQTCIVDDALLPVEEKDPHRLTNEGTDKPFCNEESLALLNV